MTREELENHRQTIITQCEKIRVGVPHENKAGDYMVEAIENSTKFPVLLTAENSNWSGEEVLDKLYSFDPGEGFTFKHDDEDGYYFRLSSHDRPTGFNVYIEELKDDS